MTKILYIMQGVPGSGKSTMADLIAGNSKAAVICSTDQLRYESGIYVFDAAASAGLHQENQRRVCALLAGEMPVVIVDNTNIQCWHARPYVQLAKIWGYDIQIVRVQCPVETAIARQKNHPVSRRVPEATIKQMAESMEDLSKEL